MSPASSNSIRWILASAVVAGVIWILFRGGAHERAPTAVAERARDHSAGPGEKRASPSAGGDAPILAGRESPRPAPARWIDSVNGITAEDRQARAERVRTRVTLARIQHNLASAPVRPEDMSRLLDLMSYKLDLRYEFSKKSAASGLPTSGPEYDRLFKEEAARVDAEIKGMVGESYFAENRAGFGRLDDRLYAWEFIGEALAQGSPLTSEQRWELNEFLKKLDPHLTRGESGEAPDPETGLTSYDAEVSRELARTLSAQQIRIFQQVRADWNLFHEEKRLRAAAGRK